MNITNKESVKEILNFWFDKNPDYNKWFNCTKYDNYITKNFKKILKEAEQGNLLDWLNDSKSYIAMILLLDQMSRRIYRGSGKAYMNDKKALLFTEMGLDIHLYKLNVFEKIFTLMPYQHSEDIEDHKFGIQLLENLINNEPNLYNKNILKRSLFHTKKRFKVIEYFGRFPKRNISLERESTEEEIDYIDEHYKYH